MPFKALKVETELIIFSYSSTQAYILSAASYCSVDSLTGSSVVFNQVMGHESGPSWRK